MSGVEARLAAAMRPHALRERGRIYDTCCCNWYGSDHAAHVAVALAVVVAEEVTAARAEVVSSIAQTRRWVVPYGFAGGPEGDETTTVMVRLDDLRAHIARAAAPPSSIGSGVGGQGGVGL